MGLGLGSVVRIRARARTRARDRDRARARMQPLAQPLRERGVQRLDLVHEVGEERFVQRGGQQPLERDDELLDDEAHVGEVGTLRVEELVQHLG